MDYPVTLNPVTYGGTDLDKIYRLIDYAEGGALSRVRETATTSPEVLRTAHSVSTSGNLQVDRHLARLDLTETDNDYGQVTASVYFNAIVPRGTTALTPQKLLDLKGRLLDLIETTGFWDSFLNGEP